MEAVKGMTHEEYVEELNALALLMRQEDDRWRAMNGKEPLGEGAFAKDFDLAKVAMRFYGRVREAMKG